MSTSVVIVDDHLLIAKAIGSVIEQFSRYTVLYEAENGRALQERLQVATNIPDIVLLDISMPEMDGFETAQWLRSQHPAVTVMALTSQNDEDSLVRMIKMGAKGYLHKNAHPIELEKALDALVSKGFYYPEWAASRVMHALSRENQEQTEGPRLTERETEFLTYVCTELTYREIGEKMFCSARTVESYRDSLFEKLGVKTRVALALYAVKIGVYKIN